ncbi:ABC transporter ATP-binding protein [Nonomuraea indica]|uniref:ABC transporter ATP-binding protein n=1 Tax=Nonomuraea indica TaxID=1581193 RepID=UPI001FEC6500|nr:ATP-binding cassette domain-containing protein [Nonomuraea indica]
MRGLVVEAGGRRVVDGLDLDVPRGRVVALVGRSGSGKSLTARAVAGLHPAGGSVSLDGAPVLAGRDVGYAFQDALASLNPTITVGRHLAETLRAHPPLPPAHDEPHPPPWPGEDDTGPAARTVLRTVARTVARTAATTAVRTAAVPWRVRRAEIRAAGEAALLSCGLPGALWDAYPFELSGGQAQRVALALAVATSPPLLIADEVTSALDPVTQAPVLDLVRAQAHEHGRTVLLITHDLAAASRWADGIMVLDRGRIVERGPVGDVLSAPRAELTRALVAASAPPATPLPRPPGTPDGLAATPETRTPDDLAITPHTGTKLPTITHAPDGLATASDGLAGRSPGSPGVPGSPGSPGLLPPSERSPRGTARGGAALRCVDVRRVLRGRGRSVRALDGVALAVEPGESVAVVGRSGSGKTTLLGTLSSLDRPTSGNVTVDARDVWAMRDRDRRAVRRATGLIFQDPLSSFDPRHTVGRVVAEALPTGGAAGSTGAEVAALLLRVGLDPGFASRRPATLSGGELQRVAIARALAQRPRVLLADEPTSGLDVLATEHVLGLLAGLRSEGLTLVVVTHDLRVARRVADRIVTMSEGRVVEDLPAGSLTAAAHPETRRLLAATPAMLDEDPL